MRERFAVSVCSRSTSTEATFRVMVLIRFWMQKWYGVRGFPNHKTKCSMTLTFINEATGKTIDSFTAKGRNSLFTHAQKMKIASLRIKLLSKPDAVNVMLVMDAEGSKQAQRLLKEKGIL